jgi:hypothetical protein
LSRQNNLQAYEKHILKRRGQDEAHDPPHHPVYSSGYWGYLPPTPAPLKASALLLSSSASPDDLPSSLSARDMEKRIFIVPKNKGEAIAIIVVAGLGLLAAIAIIVKCLFCYKQIREGSRI